MQTWSPVIERLAVIGVMGSGSAAPAAWQESAAALGAAIAASGAHLLTGGGRGLMAATARGFVETRPRRGLSIGVLPARSDDDPSPPDGYPNDWVELVVRTHLACRGTEGAAPLSRNHLNVLSSDALVVLPGGAGTATEARLALRYGRPVARWPLDDPGAETPPADLPTLATLEDVAAWLRTTLGHRLADSPRETLARAVRPRGTVLL